MYHKSRKYKKVSIKVGCSDQDTKNYPPPVLDLLRLRLKTLYFLLSAIMENMITSKLTTKSQATIPSRIRRILNLSPGDSVAFTVDKNEKVTIRKATPIDFEFAKAVEGTLTEWSSKNDEEAYHDL